MENRHILLQLGYATQQRLQGIAHFAREHGWSVTFEHRNELPRGWTGDGALMTIRADDARLADYARRLRNRDIPVVDFSIAHPEIRLPRVIGDHVQIGTLAAEHFAQRRFRHVVFFSTRLSHIHDLRYGGFSRTLREAVPRWTWCEEVSASRHDDWRAMISWLSRLLVRAPKPLGVFAYNDADAVRVLNACFAAHLDVPEEVSVLGVDDDRLITENQSVPLSSIRHDLERIGYEGAALLQRLMDGQRPPSAPYVIPPLGIVERASTDILAVSSPLVRRAMLHFNAHLSESFGTDQLADALGCRVAELRAAFADELDSTPAQELRRQRLARAKFLLLNTDQSIGSIAAATGFCDISHFSNVFSTATGTSPNAFRQFQRHARQAKEIATGLTRACYPPEPRRS